MPRGEWKGLDGSLMSGAAMARFEPVRTMPCDPRVKGEPERGRGSGTESRHGLSLGVKLEFAAFRLSEGTFERPPGDGAEGDVDGLNVAALTLRTRGDETGDPDEL